MQENIYKRLAQAEAMAAAQKAETMEVLQAAYKRACEELNEEDAAAFARKIRDKLLNETDSRVALDRFNISVPSGTSFTAWLSFLKSLGEIITGAWAIYRQALRDLPEQEGFPFNVTFPAPPEELCSVARLQADIIQKQAEAIAQAEIAESVAADLAEMRKQAADTLARCEKEL